MGHARIFQFYSSVFFSRPISRRWIASAKRTKGNVAPGTAAQIQPIRLGKGVPRIQVKLQRLAAPTNKGNKDQKERKTKTRDKQPERAIVFPDELVFCLLASFSFFKPALVVVVSLDLLPCHFH